MSQILGDLWRRPVMSGQRNLATEVVPLPPLHSSDKTFPSLLSPTRDFLDPSTLSKKHVYAFHEGS